MRVDDCRGRHRNGGKLFPQKGDEELEMKVELKLMLHVAAFVFGSKKQQYDGSIDGTSKRIRKWFEIRMGIKNYGVP